MQAAVTALYPRTTAVPGEVAAMVLGHADEQVAGHAPQTEHHTGMLQLPVGIDQSRPDRSDLRALPELDQGAEPALGGGLDVVVQEEQHVRVAGGRRLRC